MKKLRQVESEIQKLIKIRKENIVRIYAVQLTLPKSSDPSRLSILTESKPPLTLFDLLSDCESIREDRASVCSSAQPT